MLSPSKGPGDGLARLCAEVLGRSLDKQLQCSDWEQRPLSDAQVRYAALDAWALLPVFARLIASDDAHSAADWRKPYAGDVRSADAQVDAAAAAAAAETFEPLCGAGAAAVAAELLKLRADGCGAQLIRSSQAPSTVLSCKTLAFVAAKDMTATLPRNALCVVPADEEVDVSLMAAALGAAEDSGACYRLATAAELRSVFRQPRGAIGPLGPASAMGAVIVLERTLLEVDTIECGAGTHGWQLRVNPARLCRLTSAITGAVTVARRKSVNQLSGLSDNPEGLPADASSQRRPSGC